MFFIVLKEQNDGFINLSSFEVPAEIREIFNLGLNCHIKSKYNQNIRKFNVEKLYEQIKRLESNKDIVIENDELLKCELKRFGIKKINNLRRDILSKDSYQKIADYMKNKEIIVRKADKSNVFVIMNKENYVKKINDILSDNTKLNNEEYILTLKRKFEIDSV